MIARKVAIRNTYMGKLPHGVDLLERITDICRENHIQLGRIEAIGAVKKARVGFYNQKTREYEFRNFDGDFEILNLTGNVSLKDNQPMVHAHITLADREGRAFGGHLAAKTIVFACEYIIEDFSGNALERGFDAETGLPLWKE